MMYHRSMYNAVFRYLIQLQVVIYYVLLELEGTARFRDIIIHYCLLRPNIIVLDRLGGKLFLSSRSRRS